MPFEVLEYGFWGGGFHGTLPRGIMGSTTSSMMRTPRAEQKGPDEATLDRRARAHLAVAGMWQDPLYDDGTQESRHTKK